MRLSHIVREILESVEYRGYHKAPNKDRGAPLHDLTQIYPEDIYSNKAVAYYGDNGGYADKESVRIIQTARGQPDKLIKIYRAVPKNIENVDINDGDWVTINKKYAEIHGERSFDSEYKIISKEVPAKHLYTDANSIHEFGYDPN